MVGDPVPFVTIQVVVMAIVSFVARGDSWLVVVDSEVIVTIYHNMQHGHPCRARFSPIKEIFIRVSPCRRVTGDMAKRFSTAGKRQKKSGTYWWFRSRKDPPCGLVCECLVGGR